MADGHEPDAIDAAGADEALQVIAGAFAAGDEAGIVRVLDRVKRSPGFAALAREIGSSVGELRALFDPALGEGAYIALESLQLVVYDTPHVRPA